MRRRYKNNEIMKEMSVEENDNLGVRLLGKTVVRKTAKERGKWIKT